MAYYEHRLPRDPTQIGRFRRDVGEDGLKQLLKATIDKTSLRTLHVVEQALRVPMKRFERPDDLAAQRGRLCSQ
jgi:hypothetical protein